MLTQDTVAAWEAQDAQAAVEQAAVTFFERQILRDHAGLLDDGEPAAWAARYARAEATARELHWQVVWSHSGFGVVILDESPGAWPAAYPIHQMRQDADLCSGIQDVLLHWEDVVATDDDARRLVAAQMAYASLRP